MRLALGLTALVLLAALAAAGPPSPAPLPLPCAEPTPPPSLQPLRCGPENGGFEACTGCAPESGALPDGWERYVHPAGCPHLASWTTAAAHTGSASVAIDDLPGVCTGITSAPFPVLPWLPYRASYWVEGAATARSTIYIVWYADPADGLQDYIWKTGDRRAVPGTWQEQAVRDYAPPNATAARVWAYSDQDSAGRFLVDDAAVAVDLEYLALG